MSLVQFEIDDDFDGEALDCRCDLWEDVGGEGGFLEGLAYDLDVLNFDVELYYDDTSAFWWRIVPKESNDGT